MAETSLARKAVPVWAAIALGAALVGSTAALTTVTITSQSTMTQQKAHLAADAKQIKNLKAEQVSLTGQLDNANNQIRDDHTTILACETKVGALMNMRAALSEELGKWGANPLGYRIDPTQISLFRDQADRITNC